MKILIIQLITLCLCFGPAAIKAAPETGISGVYEVIVGTDDASELIAYFNEFGFKVVQQASLNKSRTKQLYGVDQPIKSWRLQNGNIDSHGLIRIIEWDSLLSDGVGYAPPETIGVRMAVMRTEDIFRINDVFNDLRDLGNQAWLVTPPVFDDLYDQSSSELTISKRRVGVREQGVYGEFFNHIFYQRYGYEIPGYGTVLAETPLKTSEITHNDFYIKGDMQAVTAYYQDVLGFTAEGPIEIDGDNKKGPQQVFQMGPGRSHYYRGFVSPNNICGKLKFFTAMDPELVGDRSDRQLLGHRGITAHSLYTEKLDMVHQLARDAGLLPSSIYSNEFGEKAFVFTGPDGSTWQILRPGKINNKPVTRFDLQTVNH